MKRIFFPIYSKSAALVAALVLTACSGHQVGDPTEKYGDLQQLATDSTIRDAQDPTRAPRVDIDLMEMPRQITEGETFEFQVRVRMDVGFEDVPHTLKISSNNPGIHLDPVREKASGALTYWRVYGSVAEDLLQTSVGTAELTFVVQFGQIFDARKSEALRGSQPSRKEIITIWRAVKRATIETIHGERRWQVGEIAEFDIVVNTNGVEPQWGPTTVLLTGCDPAVENCDYTNRLTIDPFESANQNLVAHAQFNLKNLSLNVGEESQFRVNLVLNSPNGQQYEKVYTIVAYRPEDLEAPIVSMASEPPQQVEQGKDFLLSLKVDLAGSVGELTDTEQVLRDQIGEDWQGNIECEMVVGTEGRSEVCTLEGQLSCDAAIGRREIQFVLSATEGEEVKSSTPFPVSLEVLEGEACHE